MNQATEDLLWKVAIIGGFILILIFAGVITAHFIAKTWEPLLSDNETCDESCTYGLLPGIKVYKYGKNLSQQIDDLPIWKDCKKQSREIEAASLQRSIDLKMPLSYYITMRCYDIYNESIYQYRFTAINGSFNFTYWIEE